VRRVYPNAWRDTDRMRAMRGTDVPDWPEWCFLPLQGFYAILSGGGNRRIPPERIRHLGIVGALAIWRVTQGIYRFDPDLAAAVAATPLSGDLPAETLFHLPEWCVYVETPGRRWAGRDLHGFWAHLDYEVGGVADELRLVLDLAETPDAALDPERGLLPIVFLLGEGSLADALQRTAESGRRRAPALGLAGVLPSLEDMHRVAAELAPLVALLLYLCAENAEIGDDARRPANPIPKRTKAGLRLFAPDTATAWDVGVRLGAALRRVNGPTGGDANEGDGASRHGPRPHIRRAHWHTYRTGKGRRGQRVRWVAPVPVKLADPEGLAATVRPVRPKSV
jgi:hypothetical protein